jgi:hypothetical protein
MHAQATDLKAVKMWETAGYWKSRAAGAIKRSFRALKCY